MIKGGHDGAVPPTRVPAIRCDVIKPHPSIMAVRCFSLLLLACSTSAFQLPVRPARQPITSSKPLRPSLVTLQGVDAEAAYAARGQPGCEY